MSSRQPAFPWGRGDRGSIFDHVRPLIELHRNVELASKETHTQKVPGWFL